jgi:phosphoribosylamine--glycine ligase
VVVTAPEYPDTSKTDVEILGIDDVVVTGAYVLPAGFDFRDGRYWSNKSGRILNVVGTGTTIAEARARAYAGVAKISSADPSVRLHYRTDIGL